jgi:magnesium-transporting ATPase (P-type)
MEFKNVSINGVVYGNSKVEGEDNEGMKQSEVDLQKSLLRDIKSNNEGPKIDAYYNMLAVCHTVVVDTDEKTGKIAYQASSPDELALV